LAIRQRINRLLKNSKVLYAESYTYVKENTTLIKYLRKYGLSVGQLFNCKEVDSADISKQLELKRFYTYKLINKFNLRRKATIFRFSPLFSNVK
jgi:hypothetical protein